MGEELAVLQEWPGLRGILAIETIRHMHYQFATQAVLRYYLTSCSDAPAVLSEAIRRHRLKTVCIGCLMWSSAKTMPAVVTGSPRANSMRCES